MREINKIKTKYILHLEAEEIFYSIIGCLIILSLTFLLGFIVGKSYSNKTSTPNINISDIPKDKDLKEEIKKKLKEEKKESNYEEVVLKGEGTSQDITDNNEELKEESPTKDYFDSEDNKEEKQENSSEEKLDILKNIPIKKDTNSPKTIIPVQNQSYTVQVAAFRERSEAQALVDSLRAKGLSAYILSSDIPGKGIWHRVRIGTFKDIEGAKQFATAIEQTENLTPIVTKFTD